MFGRRKKTYTTGITQPMNADEDFKYAHQYALAHWLWSKDGDLLDYIQDYQAKTLPHHYNKLFRWCDKPNKYVLIKLIHRHTNIQVCLIHQSIYQ